MDQRLAAVLHKADQNIEGGLTITTLRPVLLRIGCSVTDIDYLMPLCADETGHVDIEAFVRLLSESGKNVSAADEVFAPCLAEASNASTENTGSWAMSDLDLSNEPTLRLHDGPISFDGQVQYGGRAPLEELNHLEEVEAEAYAQALADNGLPPSTPDYPWPTTLQQAADILVRIRADEVKLWDGSKGGRLIPAVSKGFEGTSKLHVASLPGADTHAYNDIVLCCLEEQLSFGVVWETNWNKLWFWVWKLRQQEAHHSGKCFLVLTKDDGSVGFNQSIEVTYLRREGIPFEHMTVRSLLRQLRPMVQAASDCDYATVRRLLDHPDAKDMLRQTQNSGSNTLMILAMDGKAELVRRALAAGTEVDTCDFFCRTALWAAVTQGHEEVARLLLQGRADPMAAARDGSTALAEAARDGHASLVTLLLSARAEPQQADMAGCTPLYLAAQEGQDQAAAQLLRARAEVDSLSDVSATPLIVAAGKGHEALVGMLLGAHADPSRRTNSGRSALDWAHGRGHTEVVRLLLAQGQGTVQP